jgi:hypothetical protein
MRYMTMKKPDNIVFKYYTIGFLKISIKHQNIYYPG